MITIDFDRKSSFTMIKKWLLASRCGGASTAQFPQKTQLWGRMLEQKLEKLN
jgi:hypothetical protein